MKKLTSNLMVELSASEQKELNGGRIALLGPIPYAFQVICWLLCRK